MRLRSSANGPTVASSVIGVIGSDQRPTSANVAVRLALASADQLGQRTLLIDLSSSRSKVAKTLGAKDGVGFTDVMALEADPLECMQSVGAEKLGSDRLLFMPWGTHRVCSIYTTSIDRFSQMLDESRAGHDLIVVALPPATEASPGPAMGAQLDGVLLIVESEKTQIAAARRARQLLERTNARILGAVLHNYRDYLPSWLQRGT
jgi:Mrp family chromosome partitioning ATPase